MTLGLAVALVSAAITLTPPDQPAPAAPATGTEPAVLAGPKVKTGDGRKSLVEREFGGKLRRLEVDPAQAALGMMELSPEEKKATQAVLNERAALMDKLVTDNLREVVQMSQAFQAKDTPEGLRLLKGLFDKAADLRARGRLEDELAGKLAQANAAELHRLTREYWDNAIADSAKEPGPNGKPRGKFAAAAHERLVAVGNEIRLSFERTVGAGAKDVDALLKRLGATPEQESTIRAAIQETYVTTFGKPTRAQQVAGFMKIYAALDGEQRKELAKYIGEQRGSESGRPADQQNSK